MPYRSAIPKVLISRADYQIGGGVALRLRTPLPLAIALAVALMQVLLGKLRWAYLARRSKGIATEFWREQRSI
jgi:hypothetical protein